MSYRTSTRSVENGTITSLLILVSIVAIGLFVALMIVIFQNTPIEYIVIPCNETTTTGASTTTSSTSTTSTSTTTITSTTSTTTAVTTTPVTPRNCTLLNYNFEDYVPEVNLANWTISNNLSDTPKTTNEHCHDGNYCAQIGIYSTDPTCTTVATDQNPVFSNMIQSFVMPNSCATVISFTYGWGSVDFTIDVNLRNEFGVNIGGVGTILQFDVIPGVAGPLYYECNACDGSCGGYDLSPYFNQTLSINFIGYFVNPACTGIIIDNVCISV